MDNYYNLNYLELVSKLENLSLKEKNQFDRDVREVVDKEEVVKKDSYKNKVKKKRILKKRLVSRLPYKKRRRRINAKWYNSKNDITLQVKKKIL